MPVSTLVLALWCCDGAVAEHTMRQRGLECTLCFLILQIQSFTLFLDTKFHLLWNLCGLKDGTLYNPEAEIFYEKHKTAEGA